MKLHKCMFLLLCLSLFFSSLNINNNLKASISQTTPPKGPEIIFLYPENLQNSSSFLPSDYIYFTLSGNLSQLSRLDHNEYYDVRYHWEGEDSDPRTITLNDGIGFLSPLHSGLDKVYWDIWYNLTIEIHYVVPATVVKTEEGEYLLDDEERTLLSSEIYQFFSDPSLLPSEPLGLEPINYPNNSIVYRESANKRSHPTFKANGYILDSKTFTTNREILYAKELNISHKWDNATEWASSEEITFYSFSIFSIYSGSTSLFDGLSHNLYIRLENNTASEIFHFCYILVDKDQYHVCISAIDLYWQSGEIKPLNAPTNGLAINVTYDWHDGVGNHSIVTQYPTQASITVPDYGSGDAGLKYLSMWSNGSSEERYVFVFETIDPQIKLIYPVNDMAKSGMIPIVWSLNTLSGGFIDYSQYKFDLYFETATVTKTLIVSDYNPITELTRAKINQPEHQLFKSLFTYYRIGIEPMAIGLEFDVEVLFALAGMGSSLPEESTEVRFIIEETTTNTICLTDVNIKAKIIEDPVNHSLPLPPDPTLPERIQSITSDWITVYYSPPKEVSESTSTHLTLTTPITTTDVEDTTTESTEMITSESEVSTSTDITINQSPLGLLPLVLSLLGLIYLRKRRTR